MKNILLDEIKFVFLRVNKTFYDKKFVCEIWVWKIKNIFSHKNLKLLLAITNHRKRIEASMQRKWKTVKTENKILIKQKKVENSHKKLWNKLKKLKKNSIKSDGNDIQNLLTSWTYEEDVQYHEKQISPHQTDLKHSP